MIREPVPSWARTLAWLAAFSLMAWAPAGCKKKKESRGSWVVGIAKRAAKLEYRCDEVKLLLKGNGVIKLDVCGAVRWYRCWTPGEGHHGCFEETRRKKARPSTGNMPKEKPAE